MFHKIKNMIPLPDYVLNVQFADGVTKQYDMKPQFERYPMISPLRDHPELYYSAAIDLGGYGVVWNDDIDIACDKLYHNDKLVNGQDVCKFGKQWVVSADAMIREYGMPKE